MKHKTPPFSTSLEATQFAQEQTVKRTAALEKQCDGLARLCKMLEIRNNETNLRMSRVTERFMERLGRVEAALTKADAE